VVLRQTPTRRPARWQGPLASAILGGFDAARSFDNLRAAMSTTTTPAAPEFPRRYVDPNAVFDTWEAAEKYYRELAERDIRTAEEFEQWMLDFSELDAAFDEEGVSRQIDMTRATDDPEREQRFLHF